MQHRLIVTWACGHSTEAKSVEPPDDTTLQGWKFGACDQCPCNIILKVRAITGSEFSRPDSEPWVPADFQVSH